MRIFLKLSTINPSNCSQKMYHKSLSVRSCVRYIVISTNSTSSSFVALSASIPYPYLAILSFQLISILSCYKSRSRVEVEVKVEVEVEVKVEVEVEVGVEVEAEVWVEVEVEVEFKV